LKAENRSYICRLLHCGSACGCVLVPTEVVQAAGSMENLALVCETVWHHIFQVAVVRNSHVTAEII